MKKLARFIVKYRIVFAVAFVILTALGVYGTTQVKQNYDMTKYLPDYTDTKQGLVIMENEFGLSNNILLAITIDESEIPSMKKQLSAIEGVQLVTQDSYKDGKALFMVTLFGDEYSESASAALDRIKNLLGEKEYTISGSAVSNLSLQDSLKREIPIIMIIAVVIIFAVLLMTSHSWLEPLVFAIVLVCAVVINMGSNVIFGEISYITFAVSAILQLALAMDYSIILLHGYTERRGLGLSKEDALVEALAYNMRPISSSGLTTIAGLIALLFMTFRIGFDIGIVLAKGILVSLLCVIFFMPSLILIFGKALEKTQHRSIKLGGEHIAKASLAARKVLPVILVVVIIGAYVLQMGNNYTFSGWEVSSGDEIAAQFGNVNQAVVLIDNDYAEDESAQSSFTDEISSLTNENGDKAFKSVNTWTNLSLTKDDIMGNISVDMSKINELFDRLGIEPTVGTVAKIKNDCEGDFYAIEISQKTLAHLLNREESDIGLIYTLLKEDGKVTVGSIINMLYGNFDNPLLSSMTSTLPEGTKEFLGILQTNRNSVSEAINAVVSPIIDDLSNRYDASTPLEDVEIDIDDMFARVCKMLFGNDKFDVSEFDKIWKSCGGNLMDIVITEQMIVNATGTTVSQDTIKRFISLISDGRITVGDITEFVCNNSDNRIMGEIIKRVLSERTVGLCVLGYLFRDYYLTRVNSAVTELLGKLKRNFIGANYSRIILLMDLPKDGSATFEVMDSIKNSANTYFGKNNFLAGESMTYKDVSTAFKSDLLKINLVTIISILIIIAVLFRSVSLPVILVLIIQGAIWITMSIYRIFSIPIFFMSYIICICIQMGATIDYGILISSNYRRNRATMDKWDAIVNALKSSMPTIFTSGLILIAAGFIIGYVSTVMPIYSIGKLLGLGTIISILLILFMLPAVLCLLDKVISKTTHDGVKPFQVEPVKNGEPSQNDEKNS